MAPKNLQEPPPELYNPHCQIYAALTTLFQIVNFYRSIPGLKDLAPIWQNKTREGSAKKRAAKGVSGEVKIIWPYNDRISGTTEPVSEPKDVVVDSKWTPQLFQACIDHLAESLCKMHDECKVAVKNLSPVIGWFEMAAAPLPLPMFSFKHIGSQQTDLAESSFHSLGLVLCNTVTSEVQMASAVDPLEALMVRWIKPNRDPVGSLQPDKISKGFHNLKSQENPWDIVERLADFKPILFARLRQEFLGAWRAKIPNANLGDPPPEPTTESEEIVDESVKAETKRRVCFARDWYFLKLNREKGMKPAEIRDHWNQLSDNERTKICPKKPAVIEDGEKGRDVVKKGLKAAENFEKKMKMASNESNQ